MWMSKAPGPQQTPNTRYVVRVGRGSEHTAHFVEDGTPICASITYPDGKPMLAPFLCTWVALIPFDRQCGHCRRLVAKRAAEGIASCAG